MFRQMTETRIHDLHYKFDEATGLKSIIAILYAPDYVINSGGLVFSAINHYNNSRAKMKRSILCIHDTLLQIFHHQQQKGRPSNIIANQLAEAVLSDEQIHSATSPIHSAKIPIAKEQGEPLCQ